MIPVSNKKHWLEDQKENHGGKNALIYNKSVLTFSELFQQSNIISSSLIQKGIKPGDKIGLLFNHSIEFIIALNALWFAGFIPVLINTRNRAEEIANQLEFTETKIIITDEPNYDKSLAINSSNVFLFSEPINNKQNIISNVQLDLNNIAVILFTSGSTNKPKAVTHTFNNLYQSVLLTNNISKLTTDDIWLASLPFYHIGGFMILVRALVTGSTIALPETTNFIHIKEALNKYNPSHVSLVSTTLKQLLDEETLPNTNLKFVYLGGGHLDPLLCERAIESGFPLIKVYGSTETCSMIVALSKDDFLNKPNSVGKPIGNTIVKIVNETGEFSEPYKTGEIIINSQTIMKEYYKNAEETERKIKNSYYYTGDFGWIDKDGYLYIDLRRGDLIVTGGENVNPKEIEQFILQLPSVTDTYVFGEPDDKWGQIVCAAVVTNHQITENELKEQLKNMLANYKVPKKIYFIDRIPRNELGKVEKQKLIASLH